MSNRLEKIRLQLVTLNPTVFELTDDSHKHAGHAGSASGGGHYVLRIASAQFIGKNTIVRHRMIYLALGDMMKQEIHALTIQALAPSEI
jgi:BolA family transcriptional regulator, general stress-responsive regulator